MRAVVISRFGGPEVLAVREVEQPVPHDHEVLVHVEGAGLNRADLLQRAGRYPAPPGVHPDIPGMEFAGIVAQIGAAVDRWQPGDRVFGIVGGAAYAEYVLTAADQVVAVPPTLDPVAAAAVPEVFLTAYDALRRAGIAARQHVLIHAVGSGVGTAALQLVKALGATPIGTARSLAKLERARALGLEHAILQDDTAQWANQVKAAAGGAGVDIVLDFIGAPLLAPNLDVLAQLGRIVVIGTMGGGQGPIDLGVLMRKRATIIGTVLRSRPAAEKAALTAEFERDVVPLLADGRVVPVVDRVFPLAEAATAHRYMESNANFGKIVLAVKGA